MKMAWLTVWTADPSGLSSTSARTMDVVVATTLLNWKLCAHTVSSTENHIGCTWVTAPVPGLLSKKGRVVTTRHRELVRFSINEQYHSSLSTTVNTGAVTVDWPPCVHLFVCPFINNLDSDDGILMNDATDHSSLRIHTDDQAFEKSCYSM